MPAPQLHLKILDRKRRALLPKLAFLKKRGFYLAGGTALALQIGHRTSVDFDYYCPNDFDADELYQSIQKHCATVSPSKTSTQSLFVKIAGVEFSFFVYRYPLLQPLVDTEYIALTSIDDIAAMKLLAIMQRGKKRDFIDLYFILKTHTMKQIFDLCQKKFDGFDSYIAVQGLLYFADADHDQSRKRISLLQPVSWIVVKKKIIAETVKMRNELKL